MKIIQIGVGGFGGCWVKVLKENPEVKVVGMVDVSEEALASACAGAGYSKDICFRDLKEAIARTKPDAIVSVTPPARHRADVVTALKAGLHVISEKPMADTLANCKAMLKAAYAAKKVYVVSQNYRYSPPTWTMANLIQSGRIGKIGQVKVDFFLGMDFGGGFRHKMDYPLIVDMSIHHFDLIRFITGLDAVSVRGAAWNPPWSNYRGDCSSTVLFEMTNGSRILYNASWCAKGQFDDWNGSWQIEGDKGAIVYREGKIYCYDVPRLYKVEKKEEIALQEPPKQGQAFVLDDFLTAVRTGKRARTDVYDNIRSISMVFATVKAMKSGKAVKILDREISAILKKVKA